MSFAPGREVANDPAIHLVAQPQSEQLAAPARQWSDHELLETAFSCAPTGVALIDLDGIFLRVNPALCAILGRSESELLGSTSQSFTHPEDLHLTAEAYERLRAGAEALAVEKRYLLPDGEVVWAATYGTSVVGNDGRPTHFVSHFSDITAIKLADQRQAKATALFETAFADAPIGMALVNLDGRWLRVNRVLSEQLGYSEQQLLRLDFQSLTHPDDLDADLGHVQRLLAGEIPRYTMEKRYLTASGEELWVNLSVSLVRDPDSRPQHFIAQIEDVSQRRELQAALRHLAERDPLTDLWNRRRFEQELENQIARCRRYGERAALLVVDLDGFKAINDTHGHQVGDELLKRIATALSGRLREVDSFGRLGGDEFALIATGVTREEANELIPVLAQAVITATISVEGVEVGVSASIGVKSLDAQTLSNDEAFAAADREMYRIKSIRLGTGPALPA